MKKQFEILESILSQNVFQEQQYAVFESVLQEIHSNVGNENVIYELKEIRQKFPHINSPITMQGMAFSKPHGYAGDYEIIDKIYTEWKSDDPTYRCWDEYFHLQDAPRAVRNRKKYYIDLLNKLIENHSGTTVKVLNLASGPCRDIKEFFDHNPSSNIEFYCVELDSNAIAYAKQLLGDYSARVHFINKNIFRYYPDQKYDLIWSAGLFDYFDDKTFTKLLSRFIPFRNQGAEIVIGNFTDANPTMPYMEIIGEWVLNCRNERRLIELAIEAGSDPECIQVNTEPARVNLFLHIK